MAISRRTILKQGALCALFAGVPSVAVRAAATAQKQGAGKGAPPDAAENSSDRLFSFTPLTFSPFLNTPFLFKRQSGKGMTTELVKVVDLRPGSGDGTAEANGAQCFSLLFRASSLKPLPSNEYTITHDALGTFALFISPVMSRDKNSTHYEAIINHRRP
jgi:hypothetical protein